MGSITNGIYNAAKAYSEVAETGAAIAYHGSDAVISCAEAVFNTTATGWNLGLKNSLKETAKWSLGFHDYAKALQAFKRQPPMPIPNSNGREVIDMRTFGKRVGDFLGHTTNGVAKAIVTTSIAATGAAFIGGSASNALYPTEASYGMEFSDFHKASRLFSAGSSAVGRCIGSVGVGAAKAGFRIASAAGSVIADHPRAVFNTTLGSAALYLVAKEIVKAGESESYIRKASHCGLATLGFLALTFVPTLNPF